MEQTVPSANRSGSQWLAALPVFLVLVFIIILNSSHAIHAQLLKVGESTWDSYFQLRQDPVAPSCDPAVDIDLALANLIAESEVVEVDEFDLFEAEPADPAVLRQSLVAAQQQCELKFDQYEATKDRITPAVEMFRSVETGIAAFGQMGVDIQRILLAILVVVCSFTTLVRRHHIALRPMETVMDCRVAAFAQLFATGILFTSVYSFKDIAFNAGVDVSTEHAVLHYVWIVGFAAMLLVSLYQFLNIPDDVQPGGNFAKALLSIPLYAIMALISGIYFILADHVAGVGIYLNQMMELSQLFLNVGLYVWVGILLKRSVLAERIFDVLRPLKLPPELLAVAVVVLAAVPTAYTGGSGIFVIAVGGLIYSEMRRAGSRRQLALASTAMSGSLGVVLRPCLLVVIIAALNSEVTTDQLFGWGVKVFLLTTALFALYSIVTRQASLQVNFSEQARSEMGLALRQLIPYAIIIGVTLVLYALLLNAYLDEFSAPFILPVLMLVVLIYERLQQEKVSLDQVNCNHIETRLTESWQDLKDGKDSIEKTIRKATTETIGHIGALLLMMGMSVSIGGVIERVELMEMVPTDFGSIWLAMSLLVVVLVLIGMIMDPYGAVILVTATIATVAYENGIHPVHFWMVTLVAFELGYLSPPVALNHLLTRQVVGEEEVRLAKQEGHNFWYRHERILLPLVTMLTAVLIVAYVPLLVGY